MFGIRALLKLLIKWDDRAGTSRSFKSLPVVFPLTSWQACRVLKPAPWAQLSFPISWWLPLRYTRYGLGILMSITRYIAWPGDKTYKEYICCCRQQLHHTNIWLLTVNTIACHVSIRVKTRGCILRSLSSAESAYTSFVAVFYLNYW